MRLFIIFISAVLITARVAWAGDNPLEELLGKMTSTDKVLLMIIKDKNTVKPSIIPPKIFDKLHMLEESERAFLAEKREDLMEIGLKGSDSDMAMATLTWKGWEAGYYYGQVYAIMQLLYTTEIISTLGYLTPKIYIDFKEDRAMLLPSRLRSLATMLLLLDYKEKNPVGPDKFVIPVTADK